MGVNLNVGKKPSIDTVNSSKTAHRKVGLSIKINNLTQIKESLINRSSKKLVERTVVERTNSKFNYEARQLKVLKVRNNDLEDFDLLNKTLETHFFTRILDQANRTLVIKELALCELSKGKTIIKQGLVGNYFYIIKEGEISKYLNNKFEHILTSGDTFGDLSILHDTAAGSTLTASTNCYLYVLQKTKFKVIVDFITRLNYDENKRFLDTIHIFEAISNDEKILMASNLKEEFYLEESYIFKGNNH